MKSIVLPPSRRVQGLLPAAYLFTVLGFPLHELAHALVYWLQGQPVVSITFNHVDPVQPTVAGSLAGPVFSLLLAMLGYWLLRVKPAHAAPWLGLALGQVMLRPPLQVLMLLGVVGGNDEQIAARVLGLHPAWVIIPSMVLYLTMLVLLLRKLRQHGHTVWSMTGVFLAAVAGLATVLGLDWLLFDR
jgi:hypothetical protein